MELGILVNDLGFHQEAFILLKAVAKLSQDINHSCIIFQREVAPPCLIPMCAVMNISEIYSFSGVLLATNLENLRLIKKIGMMSKDIIYYPMDLDWLRKEKNFIENFKLLNDVNIITQNKFHTQAIYKYCGAKAKLEVENFDINRLIDLYDSSRK